MDTLLHSALENIHHRDRGLKNIHSDALTETHTCEHTHTPFIVLFWGFFFGCSFSENALSLLRLSPHT